MTKRAWIRVGLLGILLLSVAYLYRWQRLETYHPKESRLPAVSFRTMAEHNEVMASRSWPYIVTLEAGDGALVYFGSRHTQDPEDPQITRMESLWEELRPTVAFTENRLGLFVGPRDWGVKVFGEFAAVYHLARATEIPVYSLEPDWEVEVGEMTGAFPAEEVTLFYTLRVFLSERGGKVGEERDKLAAHLLEKRGRRPGLEGSLPDLEALDRLWDERFSHLGAWRDLPRGAVDPSPEPSRLQAMANLANEVRDRHAARVILELVNRGERVFALAGGSHVVKQEPVLRAGVEAGQEGGALGAG